MAQTISPWFAFILALIATWRLSHLLASEDGPGDVVFHLRKYLATSFFGRLMDCFGCVSLWVAAPLAFFVTLRPVELSVVWLALSGGAMLLEGLRPEPAIVQQGPESTEGDQSDGLLR
jgi:hypothetical protein